MLHLVIPFKSSWTNSFRTTEHEALFTSGSKFGDGNQYLESVALQADSRIANIRALNAKNPEMTYRVPKDYNNTARGVLARLCGEIERLSDMSADHPLQSIFQSMTYTVDICHESDDIVSLATPPNPIQSSGAGLMPEGNPFYSNTSLAEKLFSHLGGTIEDLLCATVPKKRWTPTTPTDLIIKLDELKAEQDFLVKQLKAIHKTAYQSPFLPRAAAIRTALLEAGLSPELSDDVDSWNWAGALIALGVYLLPQDDKESLINSGYLSKSRGYFKGIAMSGKLGGMTAKDIYDGAGCEKAYSTRMPYKADLWFETPEKKVKFTMGVIKKSGVLTISLNLPDNEAQDLLNHIHNAAVGPLHFGKKGMAYLERAYIES